MMAELKPCPFCGCTDLYMHYALFPTNKDEPLVSIECNRCGVEMPVVETIGQAVCRWNKRESEDVQPIVHGEWIDNEYGKPICSVCKKEMWRGAGGQYKPSDYCPSCGARMEIGE